MVTKLLNAEKAENIELCADIIRRGGLVAFPTETVYGLGANGLCGDAVNRIFSAKGRPSDNPLILHVSSIEQAVSLYRDVPDSFFKLAEVFWPAPLTIICKKAPVVPDETSAGLDTVAVRMPANEYALKLIELSGVPVAAPSANLSGKPSPTLAKHVYADMFGRIDAILDGGACKYGVESTVISLAGEPTILRPGCITPKMLSAVIGCVKVAESVSKPLAKGEKVLSPGMKYMHYSPDAKVIAFSGSADKIAQKIIQKYEECKDKRCVIFASEENEGKYAGKNYVVVGRRSDPVTFCSSLFSRFREYNDFDCIFCEALSLEDEGLAYMNRLLRACGFNVL